MFETEEKIEFDNDLNLKDTIESGQTFLWNSKDGEIFDGSTGKTYRTCRRYKGELVGIEAEQVGNNEVLVRSNSNLGVEIVDDVLGRSQYDIGTVQSEIKNMDTDDGIMEEAINKYSGLRVVKEPLFDTLISFICSTQMRVERIHTMINNMKKYYGDSLTTPDGDVMHAFPTPSQLSECSEEELRDLKLGYRAGYVKDTVDIFMESGNDALPNETKSARDELKKYKGVGTKVADCVLLYSGGYWDVVPVDTWIESAVNQYYPEIHSDSNEQIARSFESMFGQYAGFAQAYLFHYTRDNS